MKIADRIVRVRKVIHGVYREDALALCAEIERLQKALHKATFRKTADRKAYMRAYMADYRKKERA